MEATRVLQSTLEVSKQWAKVHGALDATNMKISSFGQLTKAMNRVCVLFCIPLILSSSLLFMSPPLFPYLAPGSLIHLSFSCFLKRSQMFFLCLWLMFSLAVREFTESRGPALASRTILEVRSRRVLGSSDEESASDRQNGLHFGQLMFSLE